MAAKEKMEELMIVNRRTGKALQTTGLDNGLPVTQCEPNGSDVQLWQLVKTGAVVKFVNKQNAKVLDVMHGATEAGAWAQAWEDVGGESQLWQLVKVTPTYKKILNIQSGKVLDIVDMREDDGAPAQIWDDVDGLGQQWKLVDPAALKAKAEKKAAAKAEPKTSASAESKTSADAEFVEEKPAEAAKSKTVTKKAPAKKPAARTTRKTAKK
ncbi:MAG: RICIN domain-containing protein [Acutalibacter sp.]|nr:RICIN domain-containing protein [Acutalibacter sp.]